MEQSQIILVPRASRLPAQAAEKPWERGWSQIEIWSLSYQSVWSIVLVPMFFLGPEHRIKISNRRATQRCNVSAFYAKMCSLLARRRSSQPVQRVYWPENVIDWLGKWRPTCVMRHARGQKLQSFRRKWPFYMDLYSMTRVWGKIAWVRGCDLRLFILDANDGISVRQARGV